MLSVHHGAEHSMNLEKVTGARKEGRTCCLSGQHDHIDGLIGTRNAFLPYKEF